MQDYAKQKTPTGIESLDPILMGGVPKGSVILLLGDIGAGNYEFTYSSIVNVLELMKAAKTVPNTQVPEEIRYITFTRVDEDVRHEIVSSFNIEGIDQLVSQIKFDDLSELYFDNSVVPDEWYSHSDIITRLQSRAGRKVSSSSSQISSTISSPTASSCWTPSRTSQPSQRFPISGRT